MTRLYEWGPALLARCLDCRPIRVDQALESAGLPLPSRRLLGMWGLTVEAGVRVEPPGPA